MMHAPEMSPTLDDALRALDGASVNGVISATQLAAVRGFLAQLDDVRDVPAVLLDPAQAEHMEGAYLAGVRCADESGHVLVVSLPAFLQLLPPPARLGAWFPVPAPACSSWWERFGPASWSPVPMIVGALAACSLIAAVLDEDFVAAGWLLLGAGVALLVDQVLRLPPTRCTYDCNSGRRCTCAPNQNKRT